MGLAVRTHPNLPKGGTRLCQMFLRLLLVWQRNIVHIEGYGSAYTDE